MAEDTYNIPRGVFIAVNQLQGQMEDNSILEYFGILPGFAGDAVQLILDGIFVYEKLLAHGFQGYATGK